MRGTDGRQRLTGDIRHPFRFMLAKEGLYVARATDPKFGDSP